MFNLRPVPDTFITFGISQTTTGIESTRETPVASSHCSLTKWKATGLSSRLIRSSSAASLNANTNKARCYVPIFQISFETECCGILSKPSHVNFANSILNNSAPDTQKTKTSLTHALPTYPTNFPCETERSEERYSNSTSKTCGRCV